MFVSDRHRLVFIHIQKTAGLSVTEILHTAIPDARPFRLKGIHRPLSRVLGGEPALADYWIFGFVRNPWARMVSWWSMIQDKRAMADAGDPKMIRRWESNTFWRDVRATCPDFESFVTSAPERWARMRRPQIDMLTAGDRRADFIGRTESLDEDIRFVLGRFNLPIPDDVRHVNTSKHRDYREYYTAATRDCVGRLFKADIEAFDYEF